MKSFRFRFIILGLLLCIYHVWCRTCGTIFTDPASSTYLAQIVIEGTVSQKLPLEDLYNVRINVKKVRKGDKYLPRGKRTRHLIIGDFSDKKVNEELCIPKISNDKQKYFFFLKNTTQGYKITAFPVVSSKTTSRAVRKLACRTCDKAPILKPIKLRKVREGKRLQLSCRLRSARPAPELVWKKANKILKNGKDGFKIKKTKRGIVLRKKKATLSDSGKYVCEARNVVGTTSQEVLINVHPYGKKSTKKPKKTTPKQPNPIFQTTPRLSQVTTMPELFHECPDDLQGLCFNGGTCEIIADLGVSRCRCPATHQGKRCEHRKVIIVPVKDNMDALKKDRTLTIIGLVIGVLIFICMGIAGYILAKRRRTKFYRRQAEKRQQNETNKNIPPSNSKLPSLDEVSEVSKFKLYERVIMKNREIQTDETSFLAPNPLTNTNMHLYLNPIENDILRRNPSARRNSQSRQRLSGVSDRGSKSPVESSGNQNINNNSKVLEPDDLKIPRIPKFSEADASSDDEKNDLPPLYIEICEQEQLNPSTVQQNGIYDHFVDSPIKVSPEREDPTLKSNPTVTYTPPDSSKTYSSSEYSPSTEENSPHQNDSESNTVNNHNVNHNTDNGIIVWNERGSIENIYKPKYSRRRSSADTRKNSLSNQNEMYSHLASSGANFHIYDLRDDDAPSIPV